MQWGEREMRELICASKCNFRRHVRDSISVNVVWWDDFRRVEEGGLRWAWNGSSRQKGAE